MTLKCRMTTLPYGPVFVILCIQLFFMTGGATSQERLSLLGQIVTAVEKMDDVQKQSLLIQLRREELLQKAKALDETLQPGPLTDEKIIALCRHVRNEQHGRH